MISTQIAEKAEEKRIAAKYDTRATKVAKEESTGKTGTKKVSYPRKALDLASLEVLMERKRAGRNLTNVVAP